MWRSEELKQSFYKRYVKAIELISVSEISYSKVGIFGSYARGDFRADSDIDFCIVCEELPPRRDAAWLRCLLEEIGVDCTIMTCHRFEYEDSRFMRNLRKDLREVTI